MLSWQRMDIENRFGFRGGKYTDVNNWLTAIFAALLTTAFYLIVIFGLNDTFAHTMFVKRTDTVYISGSIVFLFFWSILVLLVKSRKVALQLKALDVVVVPETPDFVLARGTVQDVLRQVHAAVDNPSHFVLFSRVERALSNLENIGSTSDMVAMLESQARNDEDHMESSYTILRGFVWAIPVLGFIGTVVGLSKSIAGFAPVLKGAKDFSVVTKELTFVTGNLGSAFETTLQGLVAALLIQLLFNAIKKSEERFLDECREYCHRNIISKLRTIALQADVTTAPEAGAEA